MDSIMSPNPQQRLASSRKAMVRHMTRDSHPDQSSDPREFSDMNAGGDSKSSFSGTWSILKHAVSVWWHHHPLSMAADLAEPVLGKYAREKPLAVLVIAAGAGAAAVVLKPWRLVSLGAMLIAALKSSEFSGALLSMFPHSGSASAHSRKAHEQQN